MHFFDTHCISAFCKLLIIELSPSIYVFSHYPGKSSRRPQVWLFKMSSRIPFQCTSYSFLIQTCMDLPYASTNLRHNSISGLFLFIPKTQINTVTLYLLPFQIFQKSRKPDRRRCSAMPANRFVWPAAHRANNPAIEYPPI